MDELEKVLKFLVNINNLLNGTSGIVGIVSLIMTFYLAKKSNEIRASLKKDIRKGLNNNRFNEKRNRCLNSLKGIIESIKSDGIYDGSVIGELISHLTTFGRSKNQMDESTKSSFDELYNFAKEENFTYSKEEIDKIKKEKLVTLIYILMGHLNDDVPDILKEED